ncbi:MAG: heterodisulfide reductase-related iron-sulfur binding cluster [Desulfurococcales archaeon]|nr:heterodisulfide reductase-related iron-sulfur binding cluster [Desulfurococcales archaeon]
MNITSAPCTTPPCIEHWLFVEQLRPVVYVTATIVVAALLYALYEAYSRWTRGNQRIQYRPLGTRLKYFTKYALLQWKVIRHKFPGTMHLLIYGGITWLFIASILRALESDVLLPLTGHRYLVGGVFEAYKLLNNVAGISVLTGCIVAIIRRALRLTPNLPQDRVYYAVHAGLITIVVTGFFLDGIASAATPYRAPYESPLWDPVGYLVFKWAIHHGISTLASIYRPLWLFHFFLAQFMLAVIPYTNLWHIVTASLNVSLARLEPDVRAAYKAVEDIDKRIEEEKPIGVVKLIDTTWKQRMDFEACTSCMRCTNACPAVASGKILSPRNIMVKLRDAMYEGKWDVDVTSEEMGELRIDPEEVFSCVTCGACVYQCPVLNNQVETIIDIRRGLISMGSEEVPEDAQNALYNIMQQGNPFGFNPADREEWIQSLAEKFGEDIIAREDEEYDYLYWIGCVTSYDPRIRPVAESVIALLKKAGIKVGVLLEESCCGEPARRIGEETLFVEIMKQNLEMLSQYKFKKLLVNCPHGYTVFKHDYKKYINYLRSNEETKQLADFLEKLEVEHHSQVLARLVREGKLKPRKRVDLVATYHDPCYLGRWNGIFEEPREVIKSVPGVKLVEMPRNRENSFCCGGGGGHLFFEIKRGERLSRIRTQEASETGAKTVAVACPMCNTMFRAEADDFNLEVKDIAEILAESVLEEEGSQNS